MNRTLRVLHVEDSERDVAMLKRHLSRAGYAPVSERVETAPEMRAALEAQEWDVILCDYALPHFNALAALAILKEMALDFPFIIVSDTIGEAATVEAMRAGAHDYLIKDDLARLAPTIERELHEAENRRARRRAEEALKDSEAELRALFAAMTDVLLVIDAEGLHLKMAPTKSAPASIYKPAAERVGKTLHEVFPQETADLFLDYVRRALAEGRTQRLEYSLSISGRETWFEGSVSPMTNNSVVWIARDITERKRVEEALRESVRSKAESLALMDTILSTAPIGFAFLNGDLLYEQINDTLAAINGLSAQQHLGRALHEVLPEMSARLEPILRRVLETGEPLVNIELSGETPADPGQQRYWLASFYPVRTHGSEVLGVGVLVLEITDRKHAEEALRESEERYRLLFERNPQPMWVFDLETLAFLEVNDAAIHHYGYSREEFLAMTIRDIRPPEDIPELLTILSGVNLQQDEIGIWRHKKKDGTIIDVEISMHELTLHGRPAQIVLAYDVTARRSLEEQLRQSQKLEAIGMLAGGIAHDFNNLLTVITGYSSLSLLRLHEEDPLHRNISEIKKAAERAAGLTRQLLAFSRKQVLQPKILDLNEVVSELQKLLRRLIGEDIGLRTVLESELGSIKADPGQIEQIIMNLAINARDAMPQGGKLTIETMNVYLDKDYARNHIAVVPGPFVMLAVSDTGTGMDQQTQARIFEPFFTTKETGKGTGLGLSTVYGIVKQSGGNIWVYSEVGRGTTFKIYLPRVDEGAEEYKRDAEIESTTQGAETILLAEDEEMVRKLACQVLEMYGYQVLEAANGGAALLICERHPEPIHLLITDVIMPEMSGRDLADRLAQVRPEMKVLYMSGYTDNAIVHQGVLDAGTNFIQKPFSTNDLARKVREVLESS